MEPLTVPDIDDRERHECDVLVIGGGTAGTMAALTAAENGATVLFARQGPRPAFWCARHGDGRCQQCGHPRKGLT